MISPQLIKKGLGSLPTAIAEYGFSGGIRRWSGIVYNRATRTVQGRSIFDEQWDVCVVLDACRVDELERQRGNFEWITGVDRFQSLASCTWKWLPRTLEATPDGVLAETIYVTANPFSGHFCRTDQFHHLDEVWRYAWDEHTGTVYPRPVTDRAIEHWRTTKASRMLVHYLQPHAPFLARDAVALSEANFTFDEESVPDPWDRVTRGELSRDVAISRYRETLKRVLEDVTILLSNLAADRVVITADHGEAFGEWGLYGHPEEIALPCLVQVPWIETTAEDRQTHTTGTYERTETSVARSDQLKALGYTT